MYSPTKSKDISEITHQLKLTCGKVKQRVCQFFESAEKALKFLQTNIWNHTPSSECFGFKPWFWLTKHLLCQTQTIHWCRTGRVSCIWSSIDSWSFILSLTWPKQMQRSSLDGKSYWVENALGRGARSFCQWQFEQNHVISGVKKRGYFSAR